VVGLVKVATRGGKLGETERLTRDGSSCLPAAILDG
jgi:hypothetical protein